MSLISDHTHIEEQVFSFKIYLNVDFDRFSHTHTQTILLRRLQYGCIAYVPLKSGTYRYPSLLREVFTPYSVSLCHIKYRCNPPYIQINNFSLFCSSHGIKSVAMVKKIYRQNKSSAIKI